MEVFSGMNRWQSPLERGTIEGDSPVAVILFIPLRGTFEESGCLGMQPKIGGKFLLKLNISKRPIAHKYREGKVKRTLKRKLKVREIVNRETFPGFCLTFYEISLLVY